LTTLLHYTEWAKVTQYSIFNSRRDVRTIIWSYSILPTLQEGYFLLARFGTVGKVVTASDSQVVHHCVSGVHSKSFLRQYM